jgi:dipeptidyl aminopeptidase/acylaminoacyl peptidase
MAEIPHMQEASLHTSDGLTLRGWFAPGERRAAVVFVHGGSANRLQLLPEARVVLRHGYGFLVYDSRACGESEGDLETWGEGQQRDVAAALDYLAARPEVDPAHIAVLGFSIGGTAVALAAAHDARARAVVLYATWTSLEEEVRSKRSKFGPLSLEPTLFVMRRAGIDIDAVRPIDVIGAIAPRPLFMIAGTLDRDTPVEVMRRLFDRAGEPKELWIEPGADHGSYLKTAPDEYERRLIGFLDRSFDLR